MSINLSLKPAHLLQSDERGPAGKAQLKSCSYSPARLFRKLRGFAGNSSGAPVCLLSALFFKEKQLVASVSCRQGVGGEGPEGRLL